MIPLKIRRLILAVCVIVFFVVGPLIVGYAMGYRWDFDNNRVIKTGLIYLRSKPWLADVYFAEEKASWHTPYQINELKPGLYPVTVKKEGYQSWSKDLPVEANKATLAEDIILFRENPQAQPLIEQSVQKFVLSPDGKYLALLAGAADNLSLWTYNLRDQNSQKIWPLAKSKNASALVDFTWSPSSRKILLTYQMEGKNKYVVTSLGQPEEFLVLSDLFELEFNNLAWSAGNDNQLFFTNNKNLHRLDLDTREISAALVDRVISFTPQNDYLYLIRHAEEGTAEESNVLSRTDQNGQNIKVLNRTIPVSPQYQVLVSDKELVAFKTAKNQLYLIQNESVKSLGREVKQAVWSRQDGDGEDKLLWQNNFEIWVYNDATDRNDIITSFSRPLNSAVWYPDFEHIIYQYQDEVSATELDGRDRRNVATLARTESDSPSLAVSADGRQVYFAALGTKQNKIIKQVKIR